MKKLYKIPTNEQLFNLIDFINKEFSDIKKDTMSIVFELDKDLLRQVDEDFFYKNTSEDKHNEFTPSDEVEINISGIKIKFIKKDEEEEGEEG